MTDKNKPAPLEIIVNNAMMKDISAGLQKGMSKPVPQGSTTVPPKPAGPPPSQNNNKKK